jgi:hypothetical protein
VSIANALAFIRLLRGDPALRDALRAAPRGEAMATLRTLALAAGRPCEAAHIETAFAIEWVARRAHFTRQTAANASAAGESGSARAPTVE